MLTSQMLVDMMLAPFEDAINSILHFLEARQITIFLIDDDEDPENELAAVFKFLTCSSPQKKASGPPQHAALPEQQEGRETFHEELLRTEGLVIGYWQILRHVENDFDRERWIQDVACITPVAARIIDSYRNRLQAQNAYIDDLTQIHNRRRLNANIGWNLDDFKIVQKKLFTAMIDIDRFKELNDTYGHLSGDEVLKQAAQLIREGVPHAFRYDSDLFCAIFYGHKKEQVIEAMENLRKRFEATPFTISDLEHHITISVGIAEFDTAMNSVMDAIDLADQALYVSKEDGRNRCTFYDDVKERLAMENNRLREQYARLEKEVEQLRQEVARKKTAGTIKTKEELIDIIEEICAKNPDSVITMSSEDFEAFTNLSDDAIRQIVALLMMNFQEGLDKRILAGELNSDEEICAYFLPNFELLFHGKLAFNDEDKLVFFKTIGEPNPLEQKIFEGKLESWKPLIVNTFTGILKKSKQRSNLTEEQHNRLLRLKKEYEKNNIEGVFPTDGKLSPEEAATELWKAGYLLFPTVESLLDRLEQDMEDQKNGTITQGANYIFKWEMVFTVSNPRGIPVPAQYIRELSSVIETWIKEHGLETEDDIYAGKYEL